MRYRHWLILSLVIVAGVVGCRRAVDSDPRAVDNKPKGPATNPKGNGDGKGTDHASSNPSVTLTREEGVVRGEVRWKGPLDTGGTDFPLNVSGLLVSIDGVKKQARPVPRLQVDKDTRGVANAVVWLQPRLLATPRPPADKPPEPVRLLQREGDCWPHVLAVVKGTRLQLASADDKASFQASGASEFEATVQKGKPVERRLDTPGLIEIRSPLAPWLSAYVWVFDHNDFATTGPDGKFQLPQPVPPGEYSVLLWHESWRFTDKSQFLVAAPLERKKKVNLGKGQGAAIEWTLSGEEK
jgi:hypothetical protein